MYNSASDIAIAQITGKVIDDYVNSEALFYPLGAGSAAAISEFTIGAWLECAWRLATVTLDAGQNTLLTAAKAAVQSARAKAQPLYEQKARREFKSRLDSFSWYLDGEQSGPGSYTTQAHTRLKLELLKHDVIQTELELRRLDGVDNRLRSRFANGPFVFESEVASLAPKNSMWWLYGSIRPIPGS